MHRHPDQPVQTGHPYQGSSWSLFGTGLFANGQWDMLAVLVPLYAVLVGLSPFELGLIVAARSLLSTALSIHGGIVMDRLGTRRVLIWLAAATAAIPLFYPVSGWFPLLFMLQLVLGLAASLSMAGAQTLVNSLTKGDTAQLARFSLASRIGTFSGPLIVGITWDTLGTWAAFILVALWGGGTLAAALFAPATQLENKPAAIQPERRFIGLLPRWSDHLKALTIAAVPAVTFVLILTFLRNGPGAIQASFFVVYLGEVGLTGTMIGMLFSLSELCAAAGALGAAPLARRYPPRQLAIVLVGIAILFIVITPLIAPLLVLLALAAALRGASQGLTQPIMFSILSNAVGPESQGTTVGLRNAVNRLSSVLLPLIMGAIAALWGVETSFYVIGVVLLAASGGLFLATRFIQNAEPRA